MLKVEATIFVISIPWMKNFFDYFAEEKYANMRKSKKTSLDFEQKFENFSFKEEKKNPNKKLLVARSRNWS